MDVMINNLECMVVELLQGNITYDNNVVEVRREFAPSEVLPCITLDIYSAPSHEYLRTSYEEGHRIILCHSAELTINLWCNTEAERRNISDQILLLYHEELFKHDLTGSLTDKYDIEPHSFVVSMPFFVDEVNEKPVLLHTVFRVSAQYLTYHTPDDRKILEGVTVDVDNFDIIVTSDDTEDSVTVEETSNTNSDTGNYTTGDTTSVEDTTQTNDNDSNGA